MIQETMKGEKMDTEIVDLEGKALTTVTQAQELTVENQASYNYANNFLRAVKELQKTISDTFRPIISAANLTWKGALAEEKKHLEPLEKAESLVKLKMLVWMQEQERARREVEAKLQAKAEKERQEALAKAEAARANGKEAQAEKHEEKAANIIAPCLSSSFDKGSVSVRKTYHAEVASLIELVKAVIDGKAPLMAIEANLTFLNSQARALKETLAYPGVRVIAEDNLSSRR